MKNIQSKFFKFRVILLILWMAKYALAIGFCHGLGCDTLHCGSTQHGYGSHWNWSLSTWTTIIVLPSATAVQLCTAKSLGRIGIDWKQMVFGFLLGNCFQTNQCFCFAHFLGNNSFNKNFNYLFCYPFLNT